MGEVWRAFDLELRVEVALKALRPEALEDERRPGWALVEIVLLWLGVGGTAWLFRRVAPAVAMLVLPC